MVEGTLSFKRSEMKPDQTATTGRDNVEIYMSNLPMVDENGVILMPQDMPGYGSTANLAAETTDEAGEPASYARDGMTEGEAWINLQSQAMTLIQGMCQGQPICPHASSLLGDWIAEWQRGYEALPIRNLQADHTAGTTLAHLVDGLRAVPVITGDTHHWQKIRRWAYYMGSTYIGKRIPISAHMETNDQVMYTRIVTILATLDAFSMPYLFIIGADASDVAVGNAGLQVRELLSPKYKYANTSTDPIWYEVLKRDKIDHLGNEFADHHTYMGEPFNYELLDAATLDNVVEMLDLKFQVPDRILKLARRLWGIGKKDKYADFAFLLNIMGDPDETGHGNARWEFGRQFDGVITYLRRMKPFEDVLKLAATKKHYTWDIVTPYINGLMTEFSCVGSVRGVLEPTTYRGIKRNIGWSTWANCNLNQGFLGRDDCLFEDPADLLDAGAIQYGFEHCGELALTWMLPLYAHTLYPYNSLWTSVSWELDELMFDIVYGMIYSQGWPAVATTHEYSITTSRLRLVTSVDIKDQHIICLMWCGRDEPRFENTLDVLRDDSIYTQLRYAAWLVHRMPIMGNYFQVARPPPGFDGEACFSIENVGNVETARKLMQLVFSSASTAGSSKVETPSPAAPTTNTEPKQ